MGERFHLFFFDVGPERGLSTIISKTRNEQELSAKLISFYKGEVVQYVGDIIIEVANAHYREIMTSIAERGYYQI